MTQTFCTWTVIQNFFVPLRHLSLAYRHSNEARNLKICLALYQQSTSVTFFCALENVWQFLMWKRNPEGPSHLVQILNKKFLLWFPFIWCDIKQFRQEEFLAQEPSLLTNEGKFHSFFNTHQTLCRNWFWKMQMCLIVMQCRSSLNIINAIFIGL